MKFSDLGLLFDGPHATPKRLDNGPYYLNITSLDSGRLDLESSDHVSEAEYTRWTKRVIPQEDDLLFSYETRLGEAALMPPGIRACLGRRMALLRPDRKVVHPKFLLYYYLSPKFQGLIDQRTVLGATVPRILLSEMPDWPVHVPSLPDQQAIAEVLGALDDKIAANRKLATTMESYLRAIFDRDLSGPDQPLHTLDELVELNPKRPAPTDPAPVIPMQSLPTPGIVIPEFTRDEPKGGVRFTNNDTLLARITPCLENGKTAYVGCLGDGEIGIGSTEYIVMRSKTPYPLQISYFIATDPTFRAEAIRRMTGTSGRQRVKAQDIAEVPMHMTSDTQVIGRFGDFARSCFQHAEGLSAESRTLAQLRDTLLPALMDGTIRVKDAEKLTEEAV